MLLEKKREKLALSTALRVAILFFASLLSAIILAVYTAYRVPWRDNWETKEIWWCFVYLHGVLMLLGMVLLLCSILNALTIDISTGASKRKETEEDKEKKEDKDPSDRRSIGREIAAAAFRRLCTLLPFMVYCLLVGFHEYGKLKGEYSLTTMRVLGSIECVFLVIFLGALMVSCFPPSQQGDKVLAKAATSKESFPAFPTPGEVECQRCTTHTADGGTVNMIAATMHTPTGDELGMLAANYIQPTETSGKISLGAVKLDFVASPDLFAVDVAARIAIGGEDLVMRCMQRGLLALAGDVQAQIAALPTSNSSDDSSLLPASGNARALCGPVVAEEKMHQENIKNSFSKGR